MITRCGGRSVTAVMAAAPSLMARTANPASDKLLAQRLHGGNIPIDDQNLFFRFGGDHHGHRMRGTELYSTLKLL